MKDIIFVLQQMQERVTSSNSLSTDLQDVFGRQILALQDQRDELQQQLEQQKQERSSYMDILEEKSTLEENLRVEREKLSEKLRQKEVLERELNRERAALQEQLFKQGKLNEVIRQKDTFEKELIRQKNDMEVHSFTCSSFIFVVGIVVLFLNVVNIFAIVFYCYL